MKRKLMIALVTMGIGIGVAATVLARSAPGTGGQVGPTAGFQPDPASPNWKLLSEDLGVMIRNDEALGLRGRLYVRRNGVWLPVATDGPGDTIGAIPVR